MLDGVPNLTDNGPAIDFFDSLVDAVINRVATLVKTTREISRQTWQYLRTNRVAVRRIGLPMALVKGVCQEATDERDDWVLRECVERGGR